MRLARGALERAARSTRKVLAHSVYDPRPSREPTDRLPTLTGEWERTITSLREAELDFGRAIRKLSLDDYNRIRPGRPASYFLGRLVHVLREAGVDGRPPYTLEEVLDLVVDDTTVAATDDRKQRYQRAERAYKAFDKERMRAFSLDAKDP